MNYAAHYQALIACAEGRELTGYCEKHHVVPRCIDKASVYTVRLTPEEHYVAHQLLVKMHPGNSLLVFAAWRMTTGNEYAQRGNKCYGWLRRKMHAGWSDKRRAAQTPEVNEKIAAGHRGKPAHNKGKPMPAHQVLQLRGRRNSAETCELISQSHIKFHTNRLAGVLAAIGACSVSFWQILLGILRVETQRRADAVARNNERWKAECAERNAAQKARNDAMDSEQHDALIAKYREGAKTGWDTLRANMTPEQLSEQRRAAALASNEARGRGVRVDLARACYVSFWTIVEWLCRTSLQERHDAQVARNKSPEHGARISAGKLLFHATHPSAGRPLAERNKQRGIELAKLSPELKLRQQIMRLEKRIADMRKQIDLENEVAV